MRFINTGDTLGAILALNTSPEVNDWIQQKLDKILDQNSAKELYLTYSLLSGKTANTQTLIATRQRSDVSSYLEAQGANLLQIGRIYLLVRVLEANPDHFVPKVANLIQLADTGELITFLKFMILLPNSEAFKNGAVDSLRTNIATVFDAIALNNPYPAKFFNEQQWNQMYLKAAFMQRNLNEILEVDKRANKELTRIISDYAHERWAASRAVDPLFWRPVANYIEGVLLEDMKRLLYSDSPEEVKAAALCCYFSKQPAARELLKTRPELIKEIKDGRISWNNLKG